MGLRIGVDVGGTGVRAAASPGGGRLGAIAHRPLVDREVDTVVEAIVAAVGDVGPAERVGVGVPGFVRAGTVLASPNFPSWKNVELRSRLMDRLAVPVAVENDANAAAFGCWLERGGKGDLVLLTLGTGVGGGVVIGGRLFRGAGGTGAELGHIYVGGDRPCGCGGIGCLETRVSNSGFVRGAIERGHSVEEAADVLSSAQAGEAWALEVCEDAGLSLGRGLVTLINMLNPDILVISGGLTAGRALLEPAAERYLRNHGIAANVAWTRIEWEGRADPFAIVGAAHLVGDELR